MTEPTWSHPDDARIAGRNRKLAIRVTIAAIVGVALAYYLHTQRDFLPRFAAVSGAAAGALVFSTLRAYENLRNLYRK